MAIVLTINGVDRTSILRRPSISLSRQIKGRSDASFTLFDSTSAYRPVVGYPVTIADNGTTVFAGLIVALSETYKRGETGTQVEFEVTCADYTVIFERRTVNRFYPAGSTTQNIAYDVVRNALAGEGFTTGGIDGFTSITEDWQVDYQTAASVMDRLTDISGEQWWVDDAKVVYLKALANSPAAPFNLTADSLNWRKISIKRSDNGYFNKLITRTDWNLGITGSNVETFTGNGIQYVFTTAFNITSTPTFKINTVAQTVYEYGVDASGQNGWYWQRGGNGMWHGQDTPVSNGATVEITYGAFLQNAVISTNSSQVSARAAIEGGTGIYESVDELKGVDNLTTVQEFNTGALANYDEMPVEIQYETDAPGLEPGMKQTVNLPSNSINATFYVTRISSEEMPVSFPSSHPTASAAGYRFRHTVSLASTFDRGAWERVFKFLLQRSAQARVAPKNEIHGFNLTGELSLTTTLALQSSPPVTFQEPSSLGVAVFVDATDGPVGQDLEIDIRTGGGSSILLSPVTLPDGDTQVTSNNFATAPLVIVGGATPTKYYCWARYKNVSSPFSGSNAANVKVTMQTQF